MEQVMDVSWMTHGKDNWNSRVAWNSSADQAQDSAPNRPLKPTTTATANGNGKTVSPPPPSSSPRSPTESPAPTKSLAQRTGRGRSQSVEGSPSQNITPPQRRGSWFSTISSRFSTSPTVTQSPPPVATPQDDTDDVTPLPKISPNRNAVLPHASRQTGDAPYVPAPPKSNQPGFLGVFRRLSSSNGNAIPGSRASHGLVERKVLNVDKHRERCRVHELSQAKLRRVAFCVDVEIAPLPKYADEEAANKKPVDKTQKRKMTEKSEGETLKNPKAIEEQKENAGVVKATGEALPKEPEKEGTQENTKATNELPKVNGTAEEEGPVKEKETTRKKEKKKKSEAERKAKKEQKRREALEKGAIPMELYFDSDSSTEDLSIKSTITKTQSAPTTNPGRIYRRCCQLRETDILTKITLQLPKTTESCANGVLEKLDLAGYFMSTPDLVTLGDFLAVVPVREVILENCGLTDEGVRVILAGLLAARKATNTGRRKSISKASDLIQQGGVVERLVLKSNSKITGEGWKHICLFIHMCRSIKYLDLSHLPFPVPSDPPKTPLNHHFHIGGDYKPLAPIDLSLLLAKAIGERLAGPELELLNISSTGLSSNQLGAIIDGVIKSGVSRLGLANNNLDAQSIQHIARYLRHAKCEGLDLGGNDLRDHLAELAAAFDEKEGIWALSLANCNLIPASLCKLFPKLVKLREFKFLDLSHNQALFESEPSALGLIRKYLPELNNLRRLHLADVSLSSEQAIALAEILPEVKNLAHINLLENPNLVSLADARTEESQEEACALYASLLAAARVSRVLVKIDIDNPSPESGEVVKALADRVVVYCMRNLQGVPDIRDSTSEDGQKDKLPDVLRHLVGHEEDTPLMELHDDSEPAPDEDYVIGGTGVVKALACVLKNREGDSGDLTKDLESGTTTPKTQVLPEKVKDTSKYLLISARKIRARLQPALAMAKASSREDIHNYHRLIFLDQTIEGIIKRFEDEFPETRQNSTEIAIPDRTIATAPELSTSVSSLEADAGLMSDTEDLETEVRSPQSTSRSNSIISHTSKALVEEEGLALRVGHRFRRGLIKQEHYDLLTSSEEIGKDPNHVTVISSIINELMEGDEEVMKDVQEEGPLRAFQKHREQIVKRLREEDPQYWESFVEAQEKARANVQIEAKNEPQQQSLMVDEEAIED
ncbi:RNI-like protein [Annulohypoxylon maeteangense]|uniref:RNI-like protein n=1 Tax=Annulohypoxylon maeteangense TaxID=1927788 RepID=UPI002008DB87|nr:RNI-like protein [Annulohypoxylon maeteangense]KAI0885791.1 RNI-like protein [Annulohypoxylon maeteangense]